MKERYQNEISQIHVPKDVLEKTRQAMNEAEPSKKNRALKKYRYILYSAAAAAVLLLLLGLPFAAQQRGMSMEEAKLHLGEQEKKEPAAIKKETEEAGFIEIKEAEKMPVQFETAQKILIGEIMVLYLKEETAGNYEAYFEKEGGSYLVVSEIKDETEFLKALDEQLQ